MNIYCPVGAVQIGRGIYHTPGAMSAVSQGNDRGRDKQKIRVLIIIIITIIIITIIIIVITTITIIIAIIVTVLIIIILGKEWDSEMKEWIVYDLKHEADTILEMTFEEYLISLTAGCTAGNNQNVLNLMNS